MNLFHSSHSTCFISCHHKHSRWCSSRLTFHLSVASSCSSSSSSSLEGEMFPFFSSQPVAFISHLILFSLLSWITFIGFIDQVLNTLIRVRFSLFVLSPLSLQTLSAYTGVYSMQYFIAQCYWTFDLDNDSSHSSQSITIVIEVIILPPPALSLVTIININMQVIYLPSAQFYIYSSIVYNDML